MLNDKLMVFNKTFDQKLPNFERSFLEKKYNTLKEQLSKEKEEYEHKMQVIKQRIKKKIRGFGGKSSNWDVQSSNSGSNYSQFSTPYIVSSTPYQNNNKKYLSTSYSQHEKKPTMQMCDVDKRAHLDLKSNSLRNSRFSESHSVKIKMQI